LPKNIKQIGNNIYFKKEMKDLLIKECYYSTEDNSQILAADKQMHRIYYISNNT
jgi:hypothetical protein